MRSIALCSNRDLSVSKRVLISEHVCAVQYQLRDVRRYAAMSHVQYVVALSLRYGKFRRKCKVLLTELSRA